ncbi:hypothetical protein EDD22DRAFT_1052849 [Suillus occidentalis]|nr:hypothetical protein EDD22DRAFT_1052849 [Suillus occidentalis]
MFPEVFISKSSPSFLSTRIMGQVCSKCHAKIAIQKGPVAMFDGKPVCNKCDRRVHAPLPTITKKTEPEKKPYEEPEAYKREFIHDGREFLDCPAHLPPPKEGYGVRRIQVPDEKGIMRYQYIRRFVGKQ